MRRERHREPFTETHKVEAMSRSVRNRRRTLCRGVAPFFLTLGLILAGNVPPTAAHAQHSAAGEDSAPMPWLVTVIHRARVSDLVTSLRQRGLRVAALDGVSPTQQVTNVASGIVIDAQGRILARLATLSPTARPEDVTVVTAEGRTFHPLRVGWDETSGYTILDVPDIGVRPPPFASVPTPTEAIPVHILSQVPLVGQRGETIISAEGVRLTAPLPPPAGKPSFVEPPAKLWPLRRKLDSARLVVHTFVGGTAEKKSPTVVLDVPDNGWSADGGIVLNDRNEVIGIAEEVSPSTYHLTPIAVLRHLVEQLTKQMARAPVAQQLKNRLAQSPGTTTTTGTGRLIRFGGWLGIEATDLVELDAADRNRLRDVAPEAVYITDVMADGPAARAGLRTGDVILAFNDERLFSVAHLARLIATTPIGQDVALKVWREGTQRTILARIEQRPAVPAFSAEAVEMGPVSPSRPDPRATPAPTERRPNLPITLSELGLAVVDLTDQLAAFFGVTDHPGPLITDVAPHSPADRAGVRAGDVITKLNGLRTPTRWDLTRVLRLLERRTSTDLSLELVRDRRPMLVTLRLSP